MFQYLICGVPNNYDDPGFVHKKTKPFQRDYYNLREGLSAQPLLNSHLAQSVQRLAWESYHLPLNVGAIYAGDPISSIEKFHLFLNS